MDRIILVHLSDVHLGSSAYLNPVWGGPVGQLVANGHDNRLIDGFMLLWRHGQQRLRTLLGLPPGQTFQVVVTGDLTRVGSIADHNLAWDFFANNWGPPTYAPPPGTSVAGLGLGLVTGRPPQGAPGALPAIPGNHDQWAGANWCFSPPAYNPFAFRTHIGPTDWQTPFVVLAGPKGALTVEIYGLDSNSGLLGKTFKWRQGGVIAPAQLAALDAGLTAAGTLEHGAVRVVLCHHAFDQIQGLLAPLAVPSREELLRVASDHHISVVLTGHTHYVDWRKWKSAKKTTKKPVKRVWELRSTTPFQGPAPSGLPIPAAQPIQQRTVCHGFLVHDISLQPGQKPNWEMHAFLWDGTDFVPKGPVNIPI